MPSKHNSIWRPCTQHKLIENIDDIVVKCANGLEIIDVNDNVYWDLISSWWVNVHGHCNKYISAAIAKQAYKLDQIIHADFLHEPAIKLINVLQQVMCGHFTHFFFADNGSTAVEIAMKMAYQYHLNISGEKRKSFIAFEGCYHGDTFGCMSLGRGSIFSRAFDEVLGFDLHIIPFPDYWLGCEDIDEREAIAIKILDNILASHNKEVIAAIFEPLLQGSAGMRVCRVSFMNQVMHLLNEYDVVTIFDEVFTAFGRTGTIFAYQQLSVSPDIICLSKGITSGALPFGLVSCVAKIYDAFYDNDIGKALLHSHSYAGNPITCAAAVASLELFQDNNTMAEVRRISKCYNSIMNNLNQKMLSRIEKIRIIGSVIAFDVKCSKHDAGYGSSFSRDFKYMSFARGLILRPIGNTIYLVPPICITDAEIEKSFEIIQELLLNIVNNIATVQ